MVQDLHAEVHNCWTTSHLILNQSHVHTQKNRTPWVQQSNHYNTVYFKLRLKIKPIKVMYYVDSASLQPHLKQWHPGFVWWINVTLRTVTGTDLIPPTCFWTRPAAYVCPHTAPSSQPQHGLAWMEGKCCCCTASVMCVMLKNYKTVKSIIFLLLAYICLKCMVCLKIQCSSYVHNLQWSVQISASMSHFGTPACS